MSERRRWIICSQLSREITDACLKKSLIFGTLKSLACVFKLNLEEIDLRANVVSPSNVDISKIYFSK